MSRARIILLAGLTSLAAGAGGCADGKVREANAYVKQVNAAQGRFAERSRELLAAIVPDDRPAHNRAALGRFYGAVDGFVAELRGIEPPARVRSLHEQLVGAVVRFGGDLRTAGAGITSKGASRILRGQEELAAATATVARRINATIAAINATLKR